MIIGHIYIGKTNAKRYRKAIKIGISKDATKRWKGINRSIAGSKERCIFKATVLFPERFEKSLHRRYKKYRKVFKGSGKTEWFIMPWYKRIWVIWMMVFYSAFSWAVIFGSGILVIFFLIDKI